MNRFALMGLLVWWLCSPWSPAYGQEAPPQTSEPSPSPETPPVSDEDTETAEAAPGPAQAAPAPPAQAAPAPPTEPAPAQPALVPNAAESDIQAPSSIEGRVTQFLIEGLRRVELAAIMASVDLREGDDLTAWKVQRDIRAVYATGFVDDVRVDAKPDPSGEGLIVTFFVVEKPAVRDVKLDGYKKLDEDALREVIDISPFSVLNESDIKENIQRMREKYLEKGFYLVEIEPVVREVGDDLVDLTFEITEHRKVLVQSIDITGNENIPDRKIIRYLQTKEAGLIPWLTSSGTFNEITIEEDAQIVNSVFLEEGFVDVQVDKPLVYLAPDKRFIYITIHVDEGPQYEIGSINVRGDFVADEGLTEAAVRKLITGKTATTMHGRWKDAKEDAEKSGGEGAPLEAGWESGGRQWLRFDQENPELKQGDTFKLSTLQTLLAEVSNLYGDQGYAFANVVPITETDPEGHIVDVTLDIQRGDKVNIHRIDITGNDPTFDKVVRREIPINEGDVYSGSAIKEGRQRLERLGFFEEVKISTPRGAEPNSLDMKVEVTEQPTGSFSVGAGFSNIENFVFTANVSKNNFMGLGYVMSAAANVSKLRQQWNLRLFDPYFLDTRWTLRLDGFSIARQYIEDEYQRGGSFAVGRYLDRRDDMRMEFDYTYEDTGLTSIDAYKKRILGGQLYRNGLTSTGGLSLVVDKRNNRIQATRGIYATTSAALSGGFRTDEDEVLSVFGGEFNFYELKANFRAFHPVSPNGEWLIFKYNTTLGHLGSTDGTVVPYIHRYRAGGINSVRGYDWYTLGPYLRASGYQATSRSMFVGSDDPTGADDRLVVGGTETWINNFELELPIIKQAGISTVVFFDAGNAFGDPWGEGHIDPLGLRTAYGAGVRWFSPMGPLRFEWGFPINPYPDERKAVFDFSIGSLF